MIILELDKPREIKFTFRAMKMVKALTGKSLPQHMRELQEKGEYYLDEEIFEKIVYCGLVAFDKELNLKDVEEMLDNSEFPKIHEKVTDAIIDAYGVTDEVEDKKEDKKK